MGIEAALIASTAMQAGTSIYSGYQKQEVYDYRAKMQERKAQQIDIAQELEAEQYNRRMQRYQSSVVARTAKAGVDFSGSPADVLVDSLTQLHLDKQVGQYNLEVRKQFTKAKAESFRYQGKQAVIQGYGGAFKSIMNYGMNKALLNTPTSGKDTGGYGKIKSSGYGKASSLSSSPYYPK